MILESGSSARIVRIVLLLIGAALIAYAVSDQPFYGGEPGFGGAQKLIAAAGAGIALCSLLPSRIGARVLALVVSSMVALAFAEMAGEIVLGPRYRPIYQYDDRLIFRLIPNRWSTMTRTPINGGVTVTHHIDSAGYRGPELLPAGHALRVAVYGDSFIHAYYTPDKETYVVQLGTMLQQRLGVPVEAVNAGVSSYGPDQESIKMEEELPWLRPALVLVAIFAGNDYGDLMRNKMFRLGADGSLVANAWKLDPKVRMLLDLGQRESILKRAARSIFQAPDDRQAKNAVDLDFLLAESEREYRSFVANRNDVVTNIYIDYYSANIDLTPGSKSSRYEVGLMRAVMRRIRDVAAKYNVPLAFLFIPHPSDVARDYDGWRVDRARFPDYDGRNQVAPLEEAAKSLNVPYVSIYDVFRAHDANALYFHGGNDHWNGAGQRLAAQVTADYLLAHGLLHRP
jgi:hypothetical protein